MRCVPALMAFTISLLLPGIPYASAAPERPVEQQGRQIDFDSRAPMRCVQEPQLVHTAYSTALHGRPVPSFRSCFSEADRIGAGYTRLVGNSAVRHVHHRIRG